MPRPPKSAPEAIERAHKVIANPADIDELLAAQAFLLPLMGLSLEETGRVLGRDRYWVSRVRSRFLKGDLRPQNHGGRRNAYLSREQEYELVRDSLAEQRTDRATSCNPNSFRVVLHKRLERAVGGTVDDSTVSDILNRYANALIPGASWSELGYVRRAVDEIARFGRALPQLREKWAKPKPRSDSEAKTS